jgi:hypothetical protein
VVRDEIADAVFKIETDGAGFVRKCPVLIRVGDVTVGFEQEAFWHICSVLTTVGLLEGSVPVKRDHAFDDASVDERGEGFVGGRGLRAALAIEISHFLLEALPGQAGMLDRAPCGDPVRGVVSDEVLRGRVRLSNFFGEGGARCRVGVEGIPEQRGKSGAGWVAGGDGQASADDSDDPEPETAAERRDRGLDFGAHCSRFDGAMWCEVPIGWQQFMPRVSTIAATPFRCKQVLRRSNPPAYGRRLGCRVRRKPNLSPPGCHRTDRRNVPARYRCSSPARERSAVMFA